jgi:hypothetical protein
MCHDFYHYPRARREGKRGCLISIMTMRVDFNASCVQNGPTLFSKPTPYFLMPIMIKGGKSMTVRTQTLLDSRAFACFIDKGLV